MAAIFPSGGAESSDRASQRLGGPVNFGATSRHRHPTTTDESSLTHASPDAGSHARTIVIQPSRGWVALRLAELWDYRELLFFLIWRDIKVRYKQTALGAA